MTFSQKILLIQIALWLLHLTNIACFLIIGLKSINPAALLATNLVIATVYFINYYVLLPAFFIDKKLKSRIVWFLLFTLMFIVLFVTYIIFRRMLFSNSDEIDSPLIYKWDIYNNYIFILLGSVGFRMALHWNKTTEEIFKIEEEKFIDGARQVINQGTASFINKNIPQLIKLSKSDPEALKKAIINFSELLRYSLYQKNSVSLNVELEMVSEFKKLCKQLSDTFELDLQIEGEITNVFVMPMTVIFRIQQAINQSGKGMNGSYKAILKLNNGSLGSVLISDSANEKVKMY